MNRLGSKWNVRRAPVMKKLSSALRPESTSVQLRLITTESRATLSSSDTAERVGWNVGALSFTSSTATRSFGGNLHLAYLYVEILAERGRESEGLTYVFTNPGHVCAHSIQHNNFKWEAKRVWPTLPTVRPLLLHGGQWVLFCGEFLISIWSLITAPKTVTFYFGTAS